MRGMISIALFGVALGLWPLLDRFDAGLVALASIGVSVALAGVACEGFTALSIATGALAALAWNALVKTSPELAGGVFVALTLSARALRARTTATRGAHVGVSVVLGAVAAWVASRYGGDGSSAVRAAAVLVSGVLAAGVLLIPVDDRVAHELASLARAVTGATGDVLLRATMLRRRVYGSEALEALADPTVARVETAWRALVDIATQRATLASVSGATAGLLDRRIEQHVEGLERIHAAADERLARAAGLQDQRLTAARLDGEKLEAEVNALIEVTAQGEKADTAPTAAAPEAPAAPETPAALN